MYQKRVSLKLFIPLVLAIAMLAVAVLPMFAGQPPAEPPSPEGDYVPGEILVKFKPGVGQFRAQSLIAGRGLQVADTIQAIDVHKITVEPGRELEIIASLQSDPNVLYAEPNYIAFALETPDDPSYGSQWGLPKIEAPAAWDFTTGSSDVIIAVVDTGIDLDHPDLDCPGKITAGWDYVNGDAIPDDDQSHGSHVAGIAAACTDNTTGVAGVAWNARLMPVKVLDSSGSGTYEDVADGITFAVDNGADVINLSLGGFSDSSTLEDAVQYAYDKGVLVVAAAGNCAQDGYSCNYLWNPIMYPAAYPTTLAVAATDSNDNWASFSEYHSYVDVSAPGVGIYSTWAWGSYGTKSGTSMSTPYVAGLAALLWSLNPNLTDDQVRDIIQSTADDLGAAGKDIYFGHGRINARQALESIYLQATPNPQPRFLIDDDSGPFPASSVFDVTTAISDAITWTAVISPPVTWLEITPPSSGTVSASSSDSFTLVATRPAAYGTYSTTVLVTSTTALSNVVALAPTEARITYVPDLYEYIFPLIMKNATP